MQPKGLIDTGPFVALLDRDDHWHASCVEAFSKLQLPLATTTAVLAELFHFLDDHPQRIADAWRMVRSGAITVLPMTNDDMPALERLMKQYADRPMDFADATLVHLAKRESLSTIFTIDHNDFETYRINGKRKFQIVPTR
ncbi:type II toxin-antitoxin system VapC family toxin [Candidatus Nitrospira salsa]